MNVERATAEEGSSAIADLIWETDPEMCEFVFGDRATWQQHCSVEWRASMGLHTHNSAMVTKSGQDIVGLIIAYPQSEMMGRYAATVSRYDAGINQRMTTVGWLFPVLPEKALYIFNLAVSTMFRGKGLGRLLLSAAEQRAHGAGLTSVDLDVPVTSPAVKFYERLGYRKLIKTDLLEPATNIPPHFRMHKRLSE